MGSRQCGPTESLILNFASCALHRERLFLSVKYGMVFVTSGMTSTFTEECARVIMLNTSVIVCLATGKTQGYPIVPTRTM